MDRSRVKFLYYITATENVRSILEHGILSHSRAATLDHVDISNHDVQRRRSRRDGLPRGLHEYAPLYFNPRNPMMYRKLKDWSNPMPLDSIAVLRVDHDVLDTPGAAIADANAAATQTLFTPSPAGLNALDESEVYTMDWNHSDPIVRSRLKQRACAELLIPDSVPPDLIVDVCVANSEIVRALEGEFERDIVEHGVLFFE